MSALLRRANALAAAGQAEALEAYRAVLASDPHCADAANNLGVLLRARGAESEALACYRRALAADPAHADAAYNLGRALLDHGQAEDAVAPLRRSAGSQAERWHTLGRALQMAERLEEARAAYAQALALAPGSLESTNNLANVVLAQGEAGQAERLLAEALLHRPGHAELRYNRALALLLLGRRSEGYREYEARWHARGFPSPRRAFGLPLWDGAPAPQATLLLHWEQGLGDTIQFARYVAPARRRVGRVVLLVQPPLARLLAATPGADLVLVEGDALPACDLQAPLLSLPHLLRQPMPPPPVPLPPVPLPNARAARGAAAGLAVGLVWAGNPRHGNDANRSLPPGALAPLLTVRGACFHNLQLGPRRAELPAPEFAPADMADTAAILSELDLVIAVDTSVAHLAATLGVPTWLLLPFAPDWRWGAAAATTDWYPRMRLFRQTRAGDWGGPLAAIARRLGDLTAR